MEQPYVEREVPTGLRPMVRRMWRLRMPSPQRFERIVPIPAVHLIVNRSTPYRVLRRGDEEVGETFAGAFLSGIQLEYLVNENPAQVHHVGAELEPWALPAFGIDPRAVAQRVVDAEALLPGIGAVDSLDGLESRLLALRDPLWRLDPRIREAVDAIVAHPSRPMGELAAQAGLTPKGFISLFRRNCGVTPKRFAAVCRHHDFLQRLPAEGPVPTWTELLAHGEYYDQPAFIREFRRFTGMTPTAYLAHRERYGPGDPSFLGADDAG